jgi:hypothetical protein
MPKIVFKKVYVLGEQYLLEQHLIRTMDGEDAVPKGIKKLSERSVYTISF